MEPTRQLSVGCLSEQITCFLCGGYFVDAFTVVECLHSFCKSCIVSHVRRSPACPRCNVELNEARLSSALRPDQTLQSVVYKLVPQMYNSEMQRRRTFYRQHKLRDCSLSPERRGDVVSPYFVYTMDDSVSLSVQYNHSEDGGGASSRVGADVSKPTIRYLQTPATCTVTQLQKLLHRKYGLAAGLQVRILCNGQVLDQETSMVDVAYMTSWDRGAPIRLFYEITAKRSNENSIPSAAVSFKKRRLPSSTSARIDRHTPRSIAVKTNELRGATVRPLLESTRFPPNTPQLHDMVVTAATASDLSPVKVDGKEDCAQDKKMDVCSVESSPSPILAAVEPVSSKHDSDIENTGPVDQNKPFAAHDVAGDMGVSKDQTPGLKKSSNLAVHTSSRNECSGNAGGSKTAARERGQKKTSTDKSSTRQSNKVSKSASLVNGNGNMQGFTTFPKVDPTINGVVQKSTVSNNSSGLQSLNKPTVDSAFGKNAQSNGCKFLPKDDNSVRPVPPLQEGRQATEDSGVDTDSSEKSVCREKVSLDVYDFDADAEDGQLKMFNAQVSPADGSSSVGPLEMEASQSETSASSANSSVTPQSANITPVVVSSASGITNQVCSKSMFAPSKTVVSCDNNVRLAAGRVMVTTSVIAPSAVSTSSNVCNNRASTFGNGQSQNCHPQTTPRATKKGSNTPQISGFHNPKVSFSNNNQVYPFVTTLSPVWKPPVASAVTANSAVINSSLATNLTADKYQKELASISSRQSPPVSINPKSSPAASRMAAVANYMMSSSGVKPSTAPFSGVKSVPSSTSLKGVLPSSASTISRSSPPSAGSFSSVATSASTSVSMAKPRGDSNARFIQKQMDVAFSAINGLTDMTAHANRMTQSKSSSGLARVGQNRSANSPLVSPPVNPSRSNSTGTTASCQSQLPAHLTAKPVPQYVMPRCSSAMPSLASVAAATSPYLTSFAHSWPMLGSPTSVASPSSTMSALSLAMSRGHLFPPHPPAFLVPASSTAVSTSAPSAAGVSSAVKTSPPGCASRQLPALRPINDGSVPVMTNQLNNFLQMVSKSAVSHPNGTWRLPTEASTLLDKVSNSSGSASLASVDRTQCGRNVGSSTLPCGPVSGARKRVQSDTARNLQNLVTNEITITKLPSKAHVHNNINKSGSFSQGPRTNCSLPRKTSVAAAGTEVGGGDSATMSSLLDGRTSSVTITSPAVAGGKSSTSVTIEKLSGKSIPAQAPASVVRCAASAASGAGGGGGSPKLHAIAENLAMRQMQGQARAGRSPTSTESRATTSRGDERSAARVPGSSGSSPLGPTVSSSNGGGGGSLSSPPVRPSSSSSSAVRQIPDPSLLHRQSLGRLAVLHVPQLPPSSSSGGGGVEQSVPPRPSSLDSIQQLTNSLG